MSAGFSINAHRHLPSALLLALSLGLLCGPAWTNIGAVEAAPVDFSESNRRDEGGGKLLVLGAGRRDEEPFGKRPIRGRDQLKGRAGKRAIVGRELKKGSGKNNAFEGNEKRTQKEKKGSKKAKSGARVCDDSEDRDACCAAQSPAAQIWRSDGVIPRCVCGTPACCMAMETRNTRQLCCLNHLDEFTWYEDQCQPVERVILDPIEGTCETPKCCRDLNCEPKTESTEDLITWELTVGALDITVQGSGVEENKKDIQDSLLIFYRSCNLESFEVTISEGHGNFSPVAAPSPQPVGGSDRDGRLGGVEGGTPASFTQSDSLSARCRDRQQCLSFEAYCLPFNPRCQRRFLQESRECNLEDTLGATQFLLQANLIEFDDIIYDII